jgi:hypothetical protein
MIRLLLRQPGAGSSVVCFSKDVKVPIKVRRTLSSVGTSSSNRCHAHENNLYGYGGQVLKIWYLKPTKVHIFKSISVSNFFLGLA